MGISTLLKSPRRAFYFTCFVAFTTSVVSGSFVSGTSIARAEIPLSGWPDIAEKAVRSVVNISSTKTRVASRGPAMDPFFRRFFGRGFRPPAQRANSLGSGVVVSEDGLVLTNNHVVEGSSEIKITLADGREKTARLVGADPASDVAVLRIEGGTKDIEFMPIGDSNTLRLGESVLAIGNPFGLGHTVTQGIVSAVGRANMGITDYENFIQTDAAINPGNSGGALVNRRGELVGINTAIVSRTGGYQGIGFAIPTDMAQNIMKKLVKTGRVSRGWLGIGIQKLTPDLATELGVQTETKGVLVSGVLSNTPAEKAGLRAGDVITHIDGRVMRSPTQLRNLVARKGGDSRVELKYVREGKKTTIKLTLGEKDDDGQRERSPRPSPESESDSRLGLTIRDLDSRARRSLQIPDTEDGVVVTQVDPGSPASNAGLETGDIIVQVNRKPVQSARQAYGRISKTKGAILMRVRRGGASQFIVIRRP